MLPALQRIRIWDLPTRVFHWALAAAVIGSIVSAKVGGNAMAWHFRLGYAILALLAFRLVWGVVGGHWSRFARFLYSPTTVLRYLSGRRRAGEHLDVGHTPTGALSVFALLAVISLQVATGLVADDEIANAGPLIQYVTSATSRMATGWHKGWGQGLLIGLVVLHVAAIVFYRVRKHQDLLGPMLSGDKLLPASVPASVDSAHTRALAAALLIACAAGVAGLISLGP